MTNENTSVKPISEQADELIQHHAYLTMGAGVVPVMVLDIIAISVIQVEMIRQLCELYKIPFQKTRIKAIVASLVTSTIARRGARSLMKGIPVIGWLLGGVSLALMGGASTMALGKLFKVHLEKGGQLFDFQPVEWGPTYQYWLEKAKKMWRKKLASKDSEILGKPITSQEKAISDLP